MCWLIHTHGPIEENHYAFRWLAKTAKGDGLVQWNLQSEDLEPLIGVDIALTG
jgi:hypothetical protein